MTWESSEDMARCLVGYIADDRRVRRELLVHFACPIPLSSIGAIRRQMIARAERFRSEAPIAKAGDGEGWEKHKTAMELASDRFARALLEARG